MAGRIHDSCEGEKGVLWSKNTTEIRQHKLTVSSAWSSKDPSLVWPWQKESGPAMERRLLAFDMLFDNTARMGRAEA